MENAVRRREDFVDIFFNAWGQDVVLVNATVPANDALLFIKHFLEGVVASRPVSESVVLDEARAQIVTLEAQVVALTAQKVNGETKATTTAAYANNVGVATATHYSKQCQRNSLYYTLCIYP